MVFTLDERWFGGKISKFAGLPSSSRKENDNMPVRFPCAGSVLLSSSGRWRCIYFSFLALFFLFSHGFVCVCVCDH